MAKTINTSKNKSIRTFPRTSISYYGKFASLITTDEGINIHTTPTSLFILSLWVFGIAFCLATIPFDNIWISIASVIVGGIFGFFLVTKLYIGKLRETFLYKDIISIIPGSPDFTINTTDNKMAVFRILPKKQVKIFKNIIDSSAKSDSVRCIYKNNRYYFTVDGVYTSELPQNSINNSK